MPRRHPIVSSAIAAIILAILFNAWTRHDLVRALLYLGTVGLGGAVAEMVCRRRQCSDSPAPVRGAGVEMLVLIGSFVAGFFWLYARFVRGYFGPPGTLRLLWIAILFGCVFSALPAAVFLARGYSMRELGVRLSGVAAVPFVLPLFAIAAAVSPVPTVTWPALLKESGGSPVSLAGTLILAAVPEEFFRFAWQTRVGALLHNRAAGWLIASVAWAILHAPNFWSQGHSAIGTLMGVVNIIPLGLLWGYLVHRTRSMIPSMLLHATNVWGLQNLS